MDRENTQYHAMDVMAWEEIKLPIVMNVVVKVQFYSNINVGIAMHQDSQKPSMVAKNVTNLVW